MMSVMVETPEGKAVLLTKGAPEEIFHQCSQFELDGKLSPMDPALMKGLRDEYASLSSDGFRVLAVPVKELPGKQSCSKEDEHDLVRKGTLKFSTNQEDGGNRNPGAAQPSIGGEILPGDNDLISQKCRGPWTWARSDASGRGCGEDVRHGVGRCGGKDNTLGGLLLLHQAGVVRLLRGKGHVVGFMGDGIDDAPALHAADIGISVDTAVDIAKESADLILLEKDLMVLEGGVIEGRKVFANILKYIRMGASSNFGNMFSVLGASAFCRSSRWRRSRF